MDQAIKGSIILIFFAPKLPKGGFNPCQNVAGILIWAVIQNKSLK
jgi:hypothetical protein